MKDMFRDKLRTFRQAIYLLTGCVAYWYLAGR